MLFEKLFRKKQELKSAKLWMTALEERQKQQAHYLETGEITYKVAEPVVEETNSWLPAQKPFEPIVIFSRQMNLNPTMALS